MCISLWSSYFTLFFRMELIAFFQSETLSFSNSFKLGSFVPVWDKKGIQWRAMSPLMAVPLANQFKVNLVYNNSIKFLNKNFPFERSEDWFYSSSNKHTHWYIVFYFIKESNTVHILKIVRKYTCRKIVKGLIPLIKRALIKSIFKKFLIARWAKEQYHL